MARHPCSYPDCREIIPTDLFACQAHWRALPADAKRSLATAYDRRKHAVEALEAFPHGAPESQRKELLAVYRRAAADHEAEKAAIIKVWEDERGGTD